MDNSKDFWAYFEGEAVPRLGIRGPTFREMFKHLDLLEGPVAIVETGCARSVDNWWGDGLSTLLFDRYIASRADGSTCVSVDINDRAVANARQLAAHVRVVQDDSVHFLSELADQFASEGRTIDLLYLDSFDLDKSYWQPSAIHHLKELTAVIRCLRNDTLVAVDDCPCTADFIPAGSDREHMFLNAPTVGGKGRLIAEYANAVGAHLRFAQYQAGWTHMVTSRVAAAM